MKKGLGIPKSFHNLKLNHFIKYGNMLFINRFILMIMPEKPSLISITVGLFW